MNHIANFVRLNQSLLVNLYARWQDEKEYEDINEYGRVIANKFPEGWSLVDSHKRPFGVSFRVKELNDTTYRLRINSSEISWVRSKK